jgi:hypothetical protein
MRDGKEAGTFDFPEPAAPESGPVLESIMGEKTPQGIVAALGVPSNVLEVSEL